MANRQQITAGHVNSLSISSNGSILSALATGGPAGTEGRGVRVVLTDDTIRGILAHLALDTRWAAALLALGTSPRVLAATRELRHFPGTVGERAELTERMKRAMDTQDADLSVGKARGTRPPRAVLNLPRIPWIDLDIDDSYAWCVSLASAIARAHELGQVTELHGPDNAAVALITPPGGPS